MQLKRHMPETQLVVPLLDCGQARHWLPHCVMESSRAQASPQRWNELLQSKPQRLPLQEAVPPLGALQAMLQPLQCAGEELVSTQLAPHLVGALAPHSLAHA